MGRSITPTFRLEMTVPGKYITPSGWDTKHAGRPNNETLRKHIDHFETSCKPGGVNAHLGIMVVSSARVVRQSNDEVVAEYKQPAFKVI